MVLQRPKPWRMHLWYVSLCFSVSALKKSGRNPKTAKEIAILQALAARRELPIMVNTQQKKCRMLTY
jgi:hypothetical protein